MANLDEKIMMEESEKLAEVFGKCQSEEDVIDLVKKSFNEDSKTELTENDLNLVVLRKKGIQSIVPIKYIKQ